MENRSLIVYSPHHSHRLEYVLNWLFNEVLSLPYVLTHHKEEIKNKPFSISYGEPIPGSFSIPDSGLLWQKDIQQHQVAIGDWNGLPTLYANNNTAGYSLPFDILSAIFFLLSRYEEYYPYTPDKHGRYPATESILFKNNLLRRPIIDEWIAAFREILLENGYSVAKPHFTFRPTYDIDIAYSYLHRGDQVTSGANLVKEMFSLNFRGVRDRIQVAAGTRADPYDSYDLLIELHNGRAQKPIYFILASLNVTKYDKNVAPDNSHMQRLIKRLQKHGTIALHPSYYSDNQSTFRKEKQLMEIIVQHPIHNSRQHYIRFTFPDTCNLLLENKITHDYSMGYGSYLGFRAGTGRPFHWYNLQKETNSHLRIFPFCFMDTTALYYEKLDAAGAFTVLNEMAKKLEEAGSELITVFHNFSLGTDQVWKGWREAYTSFVHDIQKRG